MGMTPAKWQEFIDKSRMTKTAAPHDDWTPEQWQEYARSRGMDPQLVKSIHDWNSFRIGARYNPETPQTSWGDIAHDAAVAVPRGVVHGANDVARVVGLIPAGAAMAATPFMATGQVLNEAFSPNSTASYSGKNLFTRDGIRNAAKAWWESQKGAVDSVADSTKTMYQQIQGFDDAIDSALPYRDTAPVVGTLVENGARVGSAVYTGAGLAEHAPSVNKVISPSEWGPVKALGTKINNGMQALGHKVVHAVSNKMPVQTSNSYKYFAQGTSYPAVGTTMDFLEGVTGMGLRPASVLNNTGRNAARQAFTTGTHTGHVATAPLRQAPPQQPAAKPTASVQSKPNNYSGLLATVQPGSTM